MPAWVDDARQVLVPTWMVGINTLAVARVHGIPWFKVAVAVLIGMVPAVVLAVTWIR